VEIRGGLDVGGQILRPPSSDFDDGVRVQVAD